MRQQAERLEAILWFIFLDYNLSYDDYPKQLDSLYHCCIARKTNHEWFEQKIAAEAALFQGAAILYEKPKEAITFFETALHQYSHIADSAALSMTYMFLCQVAGATGDSLAFAGAYERSLQLASHITDYEYLSMVYNNLGITCYDFGRFAEAAELYFEILKLTDKHPTPMMVSGKGSTYSNIAGTYLRLGDYKNAMLYAEKALKIAEENKEDPSDFLCMAGIILIMEENYQRALEVLQSIKIYQPHPKAPNTIAGTTNRLATCYRMLGDLASALPLARQAVELLPIEKDVSYGAAALVELANCEFETGLTESALNNALRAFQTFSAAKNNLGAVESAELLSKIYNSKNDYRKALQYSELRFKFQQQVERQQSTRQLAFGEFTRVNEVKTTRREAEVQAQLNRQRNIRYALFAGLGVLALLAFMLYNRYRLKQRTTKQLEAKNLEVEAARLRAEKSEAFKSRFLANMSHEIRTPLHGIAGFTDLVLETSLSEKQRRYLNSIQHSTERLTEVVNDILDISKLEAGEVKLRQVPFSPDRIAHDVQEALSVRAENKGIQLKVDIGEGVPAAVLGDPTRLYQILMNLAGNAVKFTEKGEVRLTVDGSPALTVSPSHALASLTFSLSDTGIGIPSEKLATIFDSFQQASDDTTARFGGTGLGLTIARELVQLHGSDIQVESEVGKGATFSFSLSLPLADATDLEVKPERNDSHYGKQPLLILLADDNAFNREIAREALLRHYENAIIVEAVDGREALVQFETENFDLILMDMQMPRMNGLEATQHIRQHFTGAKQTIPIIALTASATAEEIEKALAAGMDRHLAKPFKPLELAQVIAEVLGLESEKNFPSFKNLESPNPEPDGQFDFRFLRDFCDGDEAQMQHFIEEFKKQCPLEIERLEVAFQNEDLEALYQAAHSFKPQLEFVGLLSAASLAAKMEQDAREGQPLEVLNEILKALKDFLNFN